MSHYFDTPSGDFTATEISARFWETDWTFSTAPGVFSGTRLDPGTAVLLRTCAPPSGAKHILDLGCGYGVLAVALAVANPQLTVTAVDVNDRALALTRRNAERFQVAKRVFAMRPEAVADDCIFDEIWSNPPIRIGKSALHGLLSTWLARLSVTGVARLVVGKNLGADSLQQWLRGSGFSCARLASAKGFRVFAVTR